MDTLSSPILTIIKLNNQGAHFVEIGLYGKAVSCFSKTLTIVKQLLDDSSSLQASTYPPESVGVMATMPGYFRAEIEIPRCSCEDVIASDEVFIFKHPIFLPENSMQLSWQSSPSSLSFVVLYNLALSHQIISTTIECHPKKLRKALLLYELACTMGQRLKEENRHLTAIQAMAILNNVGQLHSALGDVHKAHQSFQTLLSTILFVRDGEGTESAKHLDGFMANIMPHIIKESGSAPAA